MDKIEKIDKSLEEAAAKYAEPYISMVADNVKWAFKAGAEWQARQLLQGSPMPENTVLFNKGVAEGRRLEREDIMKGAIECEVDWYDGPILNYSIEQSFEVLTKMDVDVGDKVRIIVLKEEEK